MKGMTPDLELPAPSFEVPGVLGKLEATRRELKGFRIWLGLASLLLGVLALAAALILADWIWVLPAFVRGLGLLTMVALALFLHFRAHRQYSRDQAAAEVEAHFPELGQRLRTVIEYAGPSGDSVPASAGLLTALRRDTDHRTVGLDFRKLVPWARFERRAVVSFLAVSFGIAALFASAGLRTAALRMLLLPVHYTTLEVEPGDLTMKAGDELKLKVILSGRPVPTAHWFYRQKKSDREWISAALAPAPPPLTPPSQGGERDRALVGALTTSLEDCQADLDYRVVAGELESRVFHVKVVHPLVLKGVEAAITPPAYTRRPPEVVREGNFKAIEGSRVQLTITLDHAPKSASLVLRSTGGEPSPEMVPLNIDGARLTGLLPPITREMPYQIEAVDEDGMKLEADSFRIKVALDLKPTLRFVRPEESLGVTPTTEVPIQVEAGDDFGVSRLGINYKVGDGPEETLHLADYKDQPVTAEALATLYLEKHQVDYKDGISYYAFALDNYPPEPHRVVSELRFIDIIPYKQAYQVVEGEGSCNGSSITLEELIARQRTNLNRTFGLERDRSVDGAAARRLATFEEELAAATAEFAGGLKAIGGPMPALDKAISAMRSATASLTAKELPSARSHEEAALKGLISVRQNIRKLLKQSSSSQASACRKFDRQQAQRIRRPPHDERNQQLARLENDLRDLARREQKLSEEIEPRGGGGPKLDPAPQKEERAKSSQKPSSKPSSKSAGSSSGGNSSPNSPSKTSLAEQQRQAVEEAEQLRQLARTDEALTDLANRRLDAAARTVQESARSTEAGRSAEAAEKARDAARKLESVARQVGALKAREWTDGLARERDLAQAIARAERELGKSLESGIESKEAGAATRSALAGRQRELAEDVAALADVLERLESGAALEHRELAQTIDRAARRNPPGEVEESMRQNAEVIGSGRTAQAARDADGAAERIDALAQDLESARRASVQPQLERLLAAEKQAALLQERLRSIRQSSQQAEADKAISDLVRLIENLANGEGALRQAADKLATATQSGVGGWTRDDKIEPGHVGYFVPPIGYTEGLKAASLALQARIQEIMLDNALVERNGPVPPQYKDMVEDYYRVLSQDLR